MSLKPKKNPRLLYSKETLKEALTAIQAGMPINSASHKYHIPRSTLHNKKMAKYSDRRPGPDTVLSTEEENTLVQWVFECSRRGIPVSKQHLLNSVALLVKILKRENPFSNGRPGRHWYQSFLRRHENVVNVINENASTAKTASSEDGIKRWFANLRGYLEEEQLLNINPTRIFCTETCLLQSPEGQDIAENLTVQFAGNASGQLVPPMLLYNYQRIPATITDKLPKNWKASKSETGYMTAENFYEYVSNCLFCWLNENKIEFPIVLFVDGRVPYLTLSLTDFCLKNKIELIALQPNCSHILQPLDVALFSPLKQAWKATLDNYRFETKAANLLKENIAPLLKIVLDSLDTVNILTNGFQACGLHPLSENIVKYNKIPKKAVEKIRTEQIEVTPFIPHEILIQEEGESTAMYEKVLQVIESLMNTETLQTFRSVNESSEWTGEVKDTNLFYIWRKIANFCKTEASSSNNSKQNIDETYETHGDCLDSDGSMNSSENVEIFFEDPLKICVTEMAEA